MFTFEDIKWMKISKIRGILILKMTVQYMEHVQTGKNEIGVNLIKIFWIGQLKAENFLLSFSIFVPGNKIGAFFRLMFIWRGSIGKGIWKDASIYIFLYFLISIIYQYALFHDEALKQLFERWCVYLERYIGFIPIDFVLGFYVSQAE